SKKYIKLAAKHDPSVAIYGKHGVIPVSIEHLFLTGSNHNELMFSANMSEVMLKTLYSNCESFDYQWLTTQTKLECLSIKQETIKKQQPVLMSSLRYLYLWNSGGAVPANPISVPYDAPLNSLTLMSTSLSLWNTWPLQSLTLTSLK